MVFHVTNPTTGTREAVYDSHTPEEVERRIALAQSAHEHLRHHTTFAERGELMNRAADLMEADVDMLAAMLVREMGKPIVQAEAEVLKCVKSMRFYAVKAEEFLADEPADATAVGASQAFVSYNPLGVVLAVMPWNYPLWQVMRFAAPALMAGNAGLLKHASNVPESALYLDALFTRAGFPEGGFSALMIEAKDVAAVIDDWRVKAVTLTGSEPAGRSVAENAGRNIKKTVLELGGSDAFLVMPSADIDKAVATGVLARINNNGQSCIAGKRFIVHADIYDEFVEKFTAAMAALVVGDPLERDTQVGPLATENGVRDLEEFVADARAKGARVLTGGDRLEGPGFFFPPTVIDQITPEMRIFAEEAFGPLASVYRADSLDHAIELANDSTFGLSSAIWTNDEAEQQQAMARLDAGAVFVNGMTISYPELPFGGIKNSGYGRELAAPGIREFTNMKTIWKA
jgi:succinate-semialdehyde dehydrogenase / glutarate-semialdehyde dehydrogenase